MERHILWLLSVLSVLPVASQSQPIQVPDICRAALADGIRDGYEVLSSRERVSVFVNRIRQIHAETLKEFREQATSVGIDIPLAEGIIGLSGSDATKASKFKTTFDSFKLDQRAEERAYELYSARMATVNTSLVQSWGRCAEQYLDAFMRLNAKGVFLDVIPFDNGSAFTARISVRSDRRHNIEIRTISPDGTACVSNFGKPVTASTTFDTATFLMTCRKDPDSKIPFAVTTNEGPANTVNVPARTSRLTELEEHLGTLESRIATLAAQLVESVPSNTVAAFNLPSCPAGWEPFAEANARVLLGSGAAPGLTTRRFGENPGGAEKVELTVDNLPVHKHQTVEAGDAQNSRFGVGAPMRARHGVSWDPNFAASYTEPVGGNKPHENMTPYFVVTFCRKR